MSLHFAVVVFLLLISLLWEVKHGTALPCDVLGEVVWAMHLQGFCGSGVLHKQSQHRWRSMPLHMAGSQPGELTILLRSSSSSFSVLCVCQCLLFSVFLPVFCTCWPCLYWSAMLSFSVSVCLHLCLFVSLSMRFCWTDSYLVPPQHKWNVIRLLCPLFYDYLMLHLQTNYSNTPALYWKLEQWNLCPIIFKY